MPPQYPNFTIEEAFEAAGPPPGGAPYGWAHFYEGEPPAGFFTNPPKNAKAIFSTCRGTKLFRTVDNPTQERQGYYWWAAQIQLTCDEIRRNFFSECKYLQPPSNYWDLYQYFDAHDIYHRGAQNLWNVINHLIYENTIVLADLLKDALPMIESWAVQVLASERAKNKLRSWNSETYQDILAVFDEDELKEIEGIETFYLNHIRAIFFKFRLDILAGRPVASTQHLINAAPASISGEGHATGKQQLARHHLPVEDDKYLIAENIETGSKVINGVVIVDGTSATATRTNAHKEAKRAQKGRTPHHTATDEQVGHARPDHSTYGPSIAAKDARPQPIHNSMGIGLGRPQTASAPPTEGRYTSAPTFGTQSTMEASEVSSDVTKSRVYPGNQHEVGEKVKGCIKPDDTIMPTGEKGSSNSGNTSSTEQHQNNPVMPAGDPRLTVHVPSIEGQACPANTTPIPATLNVFNQTMRPLYQTAAKNRVSSLIQKHMPVSYEQQQLGMRSRSNTHAQVPQVYPCSQLPPRVPDSLRRDTLGSTAFANQIPQLPSHGPCPNTGILGHSTRLPFAPLQQQVFGWGQGVAETGNFHGSQRSRGYSGPRNGSGMGWRANGTDPIHGPKVVFCKENTYSGQAYTPSHGPNEYHHRGTSYSNGGGSDTTGRSHKGSFTSNRRPSFGSNHSHNRLSNGTSRRYSNAGNRYQEASAQSSGAINSHDKPWGQIQTGIPVHSSGPPCLNADKNLSMRVKYEPCPCPKCEERDRSVYVSHINGKAFQQGRGTEELEQFFSQFGPIQEVIRKPQNANSAIVKFTTVQSAFNAVKNAYKNQADQYGTNHFRVAFRTGSRFFEPLPHLHRAGNKYEFSRSITLPHEATQRTPPVFDSQDVPEVTRPLAMPTPILEEPSVSGTSDGLGRNVQKISQDISGIEAKLPTFVEPLDKVDSQVTHESMETKPPSDTVVVGPNSMGPKLFITPPRQIINFGHDDPDGNPSEHVTSSDNKLPGDTANTTNLQQGTRDKPPKRDGSDSSPILTPSQSSASTSQSLTEQGYGNAHRTRPNYSGPPEGHTSPTLISKDDEGEEEINYGTIIQRPGKAKYVPLPTAWPGASESLPLVRDFAQEHSPSGPQNAPKSNDQDRQIFTQSSREKGKTKEHKEHKEQTRSEAEELDMTIQMLPSVAYMPSPTPTPTLTDQVYSTGNDQPRIRSRSPSPRAKRKVEQPLGNTPEHGSPKKKPVQAWEEGEPQQRKSTNRRGANKKKHQQGQKRPGPLKLTKKYEGDHRTTDSHSLQSGISNSEDNPYSTGMFKPDLTSSVLPSYPQGHENPSASNPEPFPAYRDLMSGPHHDSKDKSHKGSGTGEHMGTSSNASTGVRGTLASSENNKKLNPRAKAFAYSSNSSSATNSPRTSTRGIATPVPLQEASKGLTQSTGDQSSHISTKNQGSQKQKVAVPQQVHHGTQKRGSVKDGKAATDKAVTLETASNADKNTMQNSSKDEPKGLTAKSKGKQGKKGKGKSDQAAQNTGAEASSSKAETTSASTSTPTSISNNSKIKSTKNKQKGRQGASKKSTAPGGGSSEAATPAKDDSSNGAQNSSGSKVAGSESPTQLPRPQQKSTAGSVAGSDTVPPLTSEDWPELLAPLKIEEASKTYIPTTTSTTSTTTQATSSVRETRAATGSDQNNESTVATRRKATASPSPSSTSVSSLSPSSSATLLPSVHSENNGGSGGGNNHNSSSQSNTTTTTTTAVAAASATDVKDNQPTATAVEVPGNGKNAKKATGGGAGTGTSTIKGPGSWKTVSASAGRGGKANRTGRERRPPDGERKGG
ncbi:hypothetical protein F5X99DRAFT_260760 [Biscogniauxia marginata]|nr:hypothetical protein F5X99DRAFT_260760 [Biscogniauxia marginata]